MIFGGSIQQGLSGEGGTNPLVAPFLVSAFQYLENDVTALRTSGLFRLPGDESTVAEMRAAIEGRRPMHWAAFNNPLAVCTLIKQYLRELNPPLIPLSLVPSFLDVSPLRPEEKSARLRALLDQLPPPNYALLSRLFIALRRISRYHSQNHMTVDELARALVDCIFFSLRPSASSVFSSLKEQDHSETVIVDLIRKALLLFDPAEGAIEEQRSFVCYVCPLDLDGAVADPYESRCWLHVVSERKQQAVVQLSLKRVDAGRRLSFRASFADERAVICDDLADRIETTTSPLQWVFKSTPSFADVDQPPAKTPPKRHRRYFSAEDQQPRQAVVYLGFAFDSPQTSNDFLEQLTVLADRNENFYKIELGENDHISDGWYDTDIPRFDGILPPIAEIRRATMTTTTTTTTTSSSSATEPPNVSIVTEEPVKPSLPTTTTTTTTMLTGSPMRQLSLTSITPSSTYVLLFDQSQDAPLRESLAQVQELVSRFSTLDNKARMLALHVANAMGGFGFSADELDQRVTQCLRRLEGKAGCRVIKVGEMEYGSRLHRAVLFKYLSDNIKPPLPCRLSWKRESVYMPLHSDIRKYKRVSLDDPRLLKQTHKRTLPGSSSRIVNLPDLQTAPLEVFELISSPQSNIYRCKVGSIVCCVKIYPKQQPGTTTTASVSAATSHLPSPTSTSGPRLILQDEVLVLKKLVSHQTSSSFAHANLSTCLGYEETAGEFRVLFEFLAGGTLSSWIMKKRRDGTPMARAQLVYYALNVARGLSHLHALGTAHRDLRGGNVLLDGDPAKPLYDVVKLTGLASPRDSTAVEFLPPESPLINPDADFALDPIRADIWSFGMLLIELLTLGPPYAGFDLEKQRERIRAGRIPPNTDRTSPIFPLIEMCTAFDPSQRISARQIVDFLEQLDQK